MDQRELHEFRAFHCGLDDRRIVHRDDFSRGLQAGADPTGWPEAGDIEQRGADGRRQSSFRPCLAPVDHSHRQPDAERGVSDSESGIYDRHAAMVAVTD